MADKKENRVHIQKDSGRGLPVTNTPTPKPPTKPPASKKTSSGKK